MDPFSKTTKGVNILLVNIYLNYRYISKTTVKSFLVIQMGLSFHFR
jgi:hypothetical protein